MVTFRQISLAVNEYQSLLQQWRAARLLLQQSVDNVNAINLQIQNNIATNNLDQNVLLANLAAAQDELNLRQGQHDVLEAGCNNRKTAIQADMRAFRFLNTCHLKDGKDVVAIHTFLRWINPHDVPPGQHLRYKYARVRLPEFMEVARVAAELQVDLPPFEPPGQRVFQPITRIPVGGQVNTPGAVP